MPHSRKRKKNRSGSRGSDSLDSNYSPFHDSKSSDKDKEPNKMVADLDVSGLYASLTSLHAKFDTLNNQYKAIDKDIHGQDGIDNRVCLIEAEVGDLTYQSTEHQATYIKIQSEIELLKATVTRQNKLIDSLNAEVIDLKARSMKANLLFHNITEEQNENCEEEINHILFKTTSVLTGLFIEACHRVGPPRSKHARPRPIVARFQNTKIKDHILQTQQQNANSRAQRNNPRAPYTTPQVPEDRLESKRSLLSQLHEIRRVIPKTEATVNLVQDHIYINGEKQNNTANVRIRDLNTVFSSSKNNVNITSARGKHMTDGGLTVQANVYVTSSMQDVREAYTDTFINPVSASAAHNILVHRVKEKKIGILSIKAGWMMVNMVLDV